LQEITEWKHVDVATFHNEIVPANEPAIIRSLVAKWPAVTRCQSSADTACKYLNGLYNGTPVYTIVAPPEAGGRFFYRDDLKGVNFKRGQIPLGQVLAQIMAQGNGRNEHALAVQAMSVRETLPDFEKQNSLSLIDSSVAPTMWIGNRGRVAPHFDVHRNLACVIAGRRQFILFPPEQIANLYLGPVLDAPGGVPVSLVDIWNPDLERFPRYANALAAAQEAILEPGDALYIPSLWWHGVASLERLNVLVNYWWDGIVAGGVSPNDTLLHGMLTIAGLDKSQRQAWRDYFDYFVFKSTEDPSAHLPDGLQDISTTMSAEQAEAVRNHLSERLKEQ